MSLLLAVLILPTLFWDKGPDTAKVLQSSHIEHIAVPAEQAAAWKAVQGITVEAANPAQAKKLQAPGVVRSRVRTASATRAPWVDSNAWQLLRDSQALYRYEVPGKDAALAAAEAYTYGAHALIQTDEAGVAALGAMLHFLGEVNAPIAPGLVNIDYIDDGSGPSGEFMNLLVRRNLLFRKVSAPSSDGKLSVRLGTPAYPESEAANPSLLAAKVRSNLGDDKRLLRIYGSDVVVGRLVGKGGNAYLFLLNYGAGKMAVDGIRLRVLGSYKKLKISDFDDPQASPVEVSQSAAASEFTLKKLGTFAVVELTH